MNKTNQEIICSAAVQTYGLDSQLDMLVEECAEVIQARNKLKRYPDRPDILDNFMLEVAQVEIMIQQIKGMGGLNCEYQIEQIKTRELVKLEQKVNLKFIKK